MVRDALGGVGGSFLSNFTGFSKNFENSKIQNLKIDQNTFKMGRPSASRRPQSSKIRKKKKKKSEKICWKWSQAMYNY